MKAIIALGAHHRDMLVRMKQHCVDQQNLQGKPDAFVTFIVPGRPRGTRRRLLVNLGGPIGDVQSVRELDAVVGFNAQQVIAYIDEMLKSTTTTRRR